MYRLAIVYTNYHIGITNHMTRKDAYDYAQHEGDHVISFSIDKVKEAEEEEEENEVCIRR